MKTRTWCVAFLVLAAGVPVALAEPPRQVRVVGENVNLRTAARMDSEVLGQVVKDDVLDVLRTMTNWVEVVPPTNVDVWVYSDLVQEGVVGAAKLVARSGPGISYATIGRLEKGQKLEVRGSHGDWLKVSPPPGSSVWISRQFVVDVVPPPLPLPPAAAAAAGSGDAPPAPAVRAPSGEALTEAGDVPPTSSLVRALEQGRWVEVRGVVRRAGWSWRRPSHYCIEGQEISGGARTREMSFYVWGQDAEMGRLVGARIGVYGREYWMQGVRLPVLVPERYFTTP